MLNYMTLRTVITLKEALMIQNRLAMKKGQYFHRFNNAVPKKWYFHSQHMGGRGAFA